LHSFGMFWGSISGEDLGVWSKSGTSLRHPYGFPQIFHHCNFGVPGVGECGFESWDLTPNKDSSIFRNLGFSVLKSMLWWEWRYAGFMWSIYCIIHIYIHIMYIYICEIGSQHPKYNMGLYGDINKKWKNIIEGTKSSGYTGMSKHRAPEV
jgi:hypothetical protein